MEDVRSRRTSSGRLVAHFDGRLVAGKVAPITLEYFAPESGFGAGGNLWLFYDIRQYLNTPSYDDDVQSSVTGPSGTSWTVTDLRRAQRFSRPDTSNPQLNQALVQGGIVRTLDLYPEVPEFLYGFHIRCDAGALKGGESIRLQLKTHRDGFKLPEHSIESFRFWAVEDRDGSISFNHSSADSGRYHYFEPRDARLSVLSSKPVPVEAGAAASMRITASALAEGAASVAIAFDDRFGNVAAPPGGSAVLKTAAETVELKVGGGRKVVGQIKVRAPVDKIEARCGALRAISNPVVPMPEAGFQLYWGELHGMVFNQRPYREHFEWARDVAHLDFAAGQFFSYNACVAETWDELKQVWSEFNVDGRFVTLPAVEYGSPPDGSHRIAFFPNEANLPPLLCEDRIAAREARIASRYAPDTIVCKDYRDLYREVQDRGGILHGHFHTNFYEEEVLAEIYQKQEFDQEAEEARINRFLGEGLRLGIVAGSDTHDSRPANPRPEPGCPRPAGLTGVWAERLDRPSILAALRARRCFATTGPRIIVDFRIDGQPMGSVLEATPTEFSLDVAGTASVASVELIGQGEVIQTYEPGDAHVVLRERLPVLAAGTNYLYARLTQVDGARAWSSPIWISRPPA